MELNWQQEGPATEGRNEAWREPPPTDPSRVSAYLSRVIADLPELLVQALMVEVFDELCEVAVAAEAPPALIRFLSSPTDVHLAQARIASRTTSCGAIDTSEFLGLAAILRSPQFDAHRGLESAIRLTARTRAIDLAALIKLGHASAVEIGGADRYLIELMRFALLVHRRAMEMLGPT